jgi:hypothetical protein
LFPPGKDQIQSRLKRRAVIEVGRHIAVSRITLILVIHDGSHFLERLHDLRAIGKTMIEMKTGPA